MDLKYVPSLGMTGLFELREPYSTRINPTAQYQCVAIESLTNAVNSGSDPRQNVYFANLDSEENYLLDLQKDVYLITISTGVGNQIIFPSSALLSVPNGEGVIYRNTVLCVALSAVHELMDLSALQQQISDMVYTSLGVSSTTLTTTIGSPTILTTEQHEAVMSARLAVSTRKDSALYRNVQLQSENEKLTQQVALLEKYILDNHVSV